MTADNTSKPMRRIISFTTHPDFVAVEKMYMAFVATKEEAIINKMIATFHLSEQQAMDFFTTCATEACEQMELMSPEEINLQIEKINNSNVAEVFHAN